MELILSKLSEIEITAQKIMEDAVLKKTALSEKMEQDCQSFDAQLEKETAQKLEAVRNRLEAEKALQLQTLHADTENHIASIKDYYHKNQDQLSHRLFQKILKG